MMPRTVAPEALDSLAAEHPDALRSRLDLQRIHRAMGTRSILRRSLLDMMARHPKTQPLRVLEIGAGDGSLMLGVAQALGPDWPGVEFTLLDRQPLISPATVAHYAAVGWTAVGQVGDVLEWAATRTEPATNPWDLIVANLFLHHFEGTQLALILQAIAAQSRRFLACEPRRSGLALAASHWVGALGANAVTRQDAVLSVHAGFCGGELSTLWRHPVGVWQVQETSAGLFLHCFRAQRIGWR